MKKTRKPELSASSGCPICVQENRSIDEFDFITVLGLMKEYNWKEIWKRYLSGDKPSDSISLYASSSRYFLELHVQKMRRIILSEKFNTNPFFMQQVIQRMAACHSHDLIMEKIRKQGIDTGENPVSLSCSMGNTIVDFIANKNEPFQARNQTHYGKTPIESQEKRPADIYDLSSTLYLCQQNLTDIVFRRYGNWSGSIPEVHLNTKVGSYEVNLTVRLRSTEMQLIIPPPGNASVYTIHQVLQRMNFGHAPELILKEMSDVGLAVTWEQVQTNFKLQRFINNTELHIDFRKLA
jgi:hypothetical protein